MNVSQMYELIGEYANEVSDLKLQEIQRFGIAEFLSTKLTTNTKLF